MKIKNIMDMRELIEVARGDKYADVILKGGKIIDVAGGEIIEADLALYKGIITGIGNYKKGKEIMDLNGLYIAPGLFESHIHIESSFLTPQEFARLAIAHGTTTVVADPHEIANVLGESGVRFMIESGKESPVDFFFLVPSCVPSSPFETSGAEIGPGKVEEMLSWEGVLGLAEMMSFSGVIGGMDELLKKLFLSQGRVIDGHAPSLRSNRLNAYIASGIASDHECTKVEEAGEKLSRGMYIMIREGTAARNLNSLIPLLNPYTSSRILFVSDDIHPELISSEGHIDRILRKVVSFGISPSVALRCVTLSSADYFGLKDRGIIAPGKKADLVVFKDLKNFEVAIVIKDGRMMVSDGEIIFDRPSIAVPSYIKNTVQIKPISEDSLRVKAVPRKKILVIGVVPGEIITEPFIMEPKVENGYVSQDIERDILKVCVFERHGKNGGRSIGFVKGIGLKAGAVAQTIAHDHHNIISVGTDDASIRAAVERLKSCQGGIVVTRGEKVLSELSLPIAGLMSELPDSTVIKIAKRLREEVKKLGCVLEEPFLTLSFLSLPVVPHLKITDFGLVDVDKFEVVDLFI